jgi:hypothetical protein
VKSLAGDKAVDLRDYFSCWLSQDLANSHPNCRFRRILCFEPESIEQGPHEVIDHLFQALAPFLGGKLQLSTVAMPLLATRALGSTVRDIITSVVGEAVIWMSLGFPLNVLKIVEYEHSPYVGEALPVFAEVKAKHSRWDVFLSYSHEDRPAADIVYNDLSGRGLQVFRDVKSLLTGTAWWNEIGNAIRSSSYFLPLYSAAYLRSDMCLYEHGVAVASKKPLMFPVCLCGVHELPPTMTHTHMELCPQGEGDSLRRACAKLATLLRG